MELTDRETAMDRSDKRWRNALIGMAVLIGSWSAFSVGCVLDLSKSMLADFKMEYIEDPDWDFIR